MSTAVGVSKDALSDAVEAICHAAAEPANWPRALQAIADVFEDPGAVLLWRRDDGSYGSIVAPGLLAAQEDYQETRWRHDIRSVGLLEQSYFVTSSPSKISAKFQWLTPGVKTTSSTPRRNCRQARSPSPWSQRCRAPPISARCRRLICLSLSRPTTLPPTAIAASSIARFNATPRRASSALRRRRIAATRRGCARFSQTLRIRSASAS
jgi:hypothetical protein